MSEIQNTPTELTSLTISEATQVIKGKKASPVEITKAFIERAEKYDDKVFSFMLPAFERAMEDSRRAEQKIQRHGPRGPLHGIPFGVKDVINVAGTYTTGNSRAYRENYATTHAESVQRLVNAGAIFMGKLNTHECAHGGPSFDLPFLPARNPWSLDRFTGGSSSGSGAAVAANFVPFALGTDTGGSIRIPAGYCGVVGMKPTYGRISRHGLMPNSYSYDTIGTLAKSVRDTALLMNVLAGHDVKDHTSSFANVKDYSALVGKGLKGLTVGILEHFHQEGEGAPASVVKAFNSALDTLRDAGAVLETVKIRPSHEYTDTRILCTESDIYCVHEHKLKEDISFFGEDFLVRAIPALLIQGKDYSAASRLRSVMIAEFAELHRHFDLLVSIGPSLAPKISDCKPSAFYKNPNSVVNAFNVSGAPACVLRVGMENGLPISIQIVGRPFGEDVVLGAASVIEDALSLNQSPPDLAGQDIDTTFRHRAVPEQNTLTQLEQDQLRDICRRAGLQPIGDEVFAHVCGVVPYVYAMINRLQRVTDASIEGAGIFTIK